jgi:simple sugar transport system ATP-binding protein
MSENILRVAGITKRFGGVCALSDVGLEIKRGEIHCLVGGNGSGKSTLIKIISGFYQPDSGSIELAGEHVTRQSTSSAIRSGVQVIYQDLSVFPNLSVAENICIVHNKAENKRTVNWGKLRSTAAGALKEIGADIPLFERLENLCVADKQLVAIARAVLSDPKLLIMDEATTALTRKEIDKLFGVIKSLKKKGVAVLFVSHKLDEVFEIADRFTVLRNGKNVITDAASNADYEKMVYYMSERTLTGELFKAELDADDEPLLQVQNLTLKNGFADVSFKVLPGEVLGITGLLGSGRTQLVKSLFGMPKADSGSIFIRGKRVEIGSPSEAIKNSVAYVPEDRLTEGLFLYQSIRDNIAIVGIDQLTTNAGMVDSARVDKIAAKWRETLSILMGEPKDPIHTLSGGNQQKVVLAKWLETEPDVLLLNGPTVGVDIGAKHDLHAFVRKIVARKQTAVLIISDDIPELIENCNRILIITNGRITHEVKNTEVSESELIDLVTSAKGVRA